MNALETNDVAILQEALDDEYRAFSSYEQVVADFGEVRPFINIREAEARHIQALLTLFERYELAAPANRWPGKVARYASLQAACEAGVVAEVANGQMYDRLLSQTRRTDIVAVLRRLQQASQQRHLPAFQRCAERHAKRVTGHGHGGREHRARYSAGG